MQDAVISARSSRFSLLAARLGFRLVGGADRRREALFVVVLMAVCLVASPRGAQAPGASAAPAQPAGSAVIVDHTSVALFEQIPSRYVDAARAVRMMFVDRSVGANIDQFLNCLASDRARPPAYCRRPHRVEAFNVPGAFDWRGVYPRPNWRQFAWPGSGIPPALDCPGPEARGGPEWSKRVDCFIRFVDANPAAFDVYTMMISYLEAWDVSGEIASPKVGFFAGSRFTDIDDYEAMTARHKDRTFVWTTTNLARSIGSREGTQFNDQVRAYVRKRGGYLLDIADIESHDPMGRPCYDNRDGVPYVVDGRVVEDYPDDRQNYPAICQHYTSEKDGGHLNPSAGGIRLAKAWWVMMARIAGWTP